MGDSVIERTFGGASPNNFGVQLTAENIASHLAATRDRGEAYRQSHTTDLGELRELLCTSYRDAKAQIPTLDSRSAPALHAILVEEARCH